VLNNDEWIDAHAYTFHHPGLMIKLLFWTSISHGNKRDDHLNKRELKEWSLNIT
jgi:hypothetical protein